MTRPPAVSILTTCYDREAYLGQAIESVLASSFEDFEYIIVDDGSSDSSVEIAQRYAAADPRIRVHVNERNLGDYPNRNRAASFAQGEYIKYVDSDDIICPHGLQVMVECMRRFPDAALGVCRPPDGVRPYPYSLHPAEAYRRHFFGDGLFSNGPLSSIIRRASFEATGGFSGRRYLGDTELWLGLARRQPVVLMVAGLTWWRSHGTQEMGHEIKSLDALSPRFDMVKDALEHALCPLTADEVQRAMTALGAGHAQEVIGIARRISFRRAARIAKVSGLSATDFARAIGARFGVWP